MGCASSRPVRKEPRAAERTGPDMLSFDTHYGPSTYSQAPPPVVHGRHTQYRPNTLPQAPPPVARGRSRHPYPSQEPVTRTDAPRRGTTRREVTRHSSDQHNRQGRSRSRHERYRDVSPLGYHYEAPRRYPAYRDVSPIGSSRFERPFERAHVRTARTEPEMESNFHDGGIGVWETW